MHGSTATCLVCLLHFRQSDDRCCLLKVTHCERRDSQHHLRELFTWVGKRIRDTIHLSIYIKYPVWDSQSLRCTPDDLLHCFLRSGYGLNANMEITTGDMGLKCPNATHLGRLQDWVMAFCPRVDTVSMSLDKATWWLLTGPSLRHMCMYFPSRQTSQGLSKDMSGFDSKNLPCLEMLFLQGSPKPLELKGIYFQDSERLKAVHISDCWMNDLSLPLSCKLNVSAQSSVFIARMDELPEHPLVSTATHVCLPTDLPDIMRGKWCPPTIWEPGYAFTCRDDRAKDALGIPNMFSAMRSLHLTRPQVGFRPSSRLKGEDDEWVDGEIFRNDFKEMYQPAHAMSLISLRCLSQQWQHPYLRDLIIEGESLGIIIPALPCLKTLLVYCTENIAVNFINPAGLGHTVTKMSIRGKRICIDMQQQHELCKSIKARNLELSRDWSEWVMLYDSGCPIPNMTVGYHCMCKACPQCLGIGVDYKPYV